MATLRTFIAVDLPAEVVNGSQQLVRKLTKIAPGVKWVEPKNMHLTLKFLGKMRENETYAICQAISKAVASIEPFEIHFQGAGAFPKLERPRTLWIGVGDGAEQLTALYNAVDDAMADLGIARDPKRFLPHLTLGGRVKQPGPWLAAVSRMVADHSELDVGPAIVEEVVLYSSELTSDGPIYAPIGRSELKA